jgi:hypothetical protein
MNDGYWASGDLVDCDVAGSVPLARRVGQEEQVTTVESRFH